MKLTLTCYSTVPSQFNTPLGTSFLMHFLSLYLKNYWWKWVRVRIFQHPVIELVYLYIFVTVIFKSFHFKRFGNFKGALAKLREKDPILYPIVWDQNFLLLINLVKRIFWNFLNSILKKIIYMFYTIAD